MAKAKNYRIRISADRAAAVLKAHRSFVAATKRTSETAHKRKRDRLLAQLTDLEAAHLRALCASMESLIAKRAA
jgi:hypothetical protein